MRLDRILGVYNENEQKVFCFFGLKIKIKREVTLDDIRNTEVTIIQGVQRSIATAFLHQNTFAEYRNKYFHQEVVLIGAGPSVEYFTPFDDSKIYVGCNRVFLKENIYFNYLFSIDKAGLDSGTETYYNDFFNYRKGECVKFIGDQNLGENFQIPESELLKHDIKRYKTNAGYLPDKFYLDIDSFPLANFATVSLQALQFILFTNPSKIYIVGIDCTTSTGKHFTGFDFFPESRNENSSVNDEYNIKGYEQIKQFAKMYYPDTEIISVNPVGLKGMFKDVYTKSYIDANPEIKTVLGNDIVYL